MKSFGKFILLSLFFNSFLYSSSSLLTLENDAIVGKDNHYTNGLFYTWMSDNNTTFPDILPFLNMKQKNIAFSISHAIFTPKNKQRSDRNLNDLPYAGYLDFNFLYYKSSANFFNELGVNLGLIGPSTKADNLQKWFHSVLGQGKPKGWDTQLKDHFLSGISYNIGYKTTPINVNSLSFDTTVNLRGDYGNFYSGFVTGASMRLSSIPLKSFGVAGNFIGANESLLLNYKEKTKLNWAFSISAYYNKFYKYYLADKAIDEGYNLRKIDFMLGAKASFDIYYKGYKTSFYLKSVDIFRDSTSSHTNEKTGGISVVWNF